MALFYFCYYQYKNVHMKDSAPRPAWVLSPFHMVTGFKILGFSNPPMMTHQLTEVTVNITRTGSKYVFK